MNYLKTVSASFTRPSNTTPYSVGDLVANSATDTAVVPMTFSVTRLAAGDVVIRRARLRASGAALTDAAFSLHLYSSSPTSAAGDNEAYSTNGAANYLGTISFVLSVVMTDGVVGYATSFDPMYLHLLGGTDIYGLLEADDTYVPASGETFQVSLELEQF